MVGRLSRVFTDGMHIPCAVVAWNWSAYYDDDIEEIIIAYPEPHPGMGRRDFVEPDTERARRRLRETLERSYPGISIRDSLD